MYSLESFRGEVRKAKSVKRDSIILASYGEK